MSVKNIFKQTQRNNATSDCIMKNKFTKHDDSNAKGEYHALDTLEWSEIDSHIMDKNRLGVGRENGGKEALVYIQIQEPGRIEECKNYLLFHKKDWIEYRKERGERKHQKTKVLENGAIWVGDTEKIKFRVFIHK